MSRIRGAAAVWVLILLLANGLMVSGNGRADAVGSGEHGRDTSRAVTLIYNVYDLQNMSNDLNGSYELANDIDASDTVNWNGGAGFAPVGNYTNLFIGTLDGKGYNITGLFINRSTTLYVGLFGYAGNNNTVKNLGVVNINVTGEEDVGGLVGYDDYGTVNNSYVSGTVTGNWDTGGLVGYDEYVTVNNSYVSGTVGGGCLVGGLVGCVHLGGTVNNSYAMGDVTGGGYEVGGLVGVISDGTVNNSYATGNVTGTDDHGAHVGGLVGNNAGTISNSHATGNVTGRSEFIGGLSGYNSGTISNSYATGNVTGIGDNADKVGGLVGGFDTVGTVENSYATGNVTGRGSVGGLVGSLSHGGMVNNSIAAGYVNGTSGVGGLVGDILSGKVSNSHATGNVNGLWGVGGLVGSASIEGGRDQNDEGMIINSYATGNVNGNGWVGGLAGYIFYRAVINSYATGNVNGSIDVGGLVGGTMYGPVNKSYATGNVNGMNYTGGLVGLSLSDVFTSFATGNVTGINYTGGLVGCNEHDMNNSYAWGNVNGTAQYVGGLTGYNGYGKLSNSYSSGNVTGTENNIGGLVGFTENGTVSNCFWDNETSGQKTSDGGSGRNTAEMKTRGTFTDAGWDFTNVWFIVQNITYPLLRAFDLKLYANAGADMTVDEGALVTFDGSGSYDVFGIVNYTWTLMDIVPVTIYGVQPTRQFLNPGIFVVTLNVTDVGGCWDTDTMTVVVNDTKAPVADAGPDQMVDEGTLATFNGTESSDNVGIVNYTWTFTDAVPVTLYGVQPKHLFDNPGIFVVTLNVSDAAGNRDNDTMTVTVNDITPPVADAGPDQIFDEGTLVTFDGGRSRDNVGIVNYTWTFTDAVPVTLYGVQPKHLFDKPGIFVVTLNVTDAAGNWGTDSMTVTVKDMTAPVADAGPDRIIDEGTLMTFDGSGSSDNAGIANYTWTFTDGIPITLYGVRPTYKFDNPGIFKVTLNATDAAGNWGYDTMTVTVKDIMAPISDAGPDRTIDVGTLMIFNGSGSIDNIGVVNYTWTFTDGEPVTLYGARPTYKFDNPGIFLVTLKVADAAGNWGIDTVTVTVSPKPVPPAPEKPQCTIVYPLNGSKIGGRIIIHGTAVNGTLPLTIIQVRIDGGDWMTAIGLKNWTLSVNLGQMRNGSHMIQARAFDGSLYSNTTWVTFSVVNPEPGVSLWGNQWWLPAIIIAVAAGFGVLLVLSKKKGDRAR